MSAWAARRFWTDVTVETVPGGYAIRLDARPLRTPLKADLVLPTPGLADAVAAEWRAQDGLVDPRTMPFTRAANSAIDKIVPQRAEVLAMLAAYGGSDLLCYRAEGPQELAARQSSGWDPWLAWADRRLGARLSVTRGLVPIDQDPAALDRLAAALDPMSAFQIAGAHDLITISGSLVLALAVCQGDLSPEGAWDLARIDEDWQIEQWGRDEEADALATARRDDFMRADRIFRLSSS